MSIYVVKSVEVNTIVVLGKVISVVFSKHMKLATHAVIEIEKEC